MTPEVRDRIDQIQQGIVPEGYKKTKSGILPESWSVRTIAECLERVEHPVEVQANEMYTQIGIRSHGKGLFYKEPVTGDSLGNKSVFWIEPDCFILNIVFAWEQAIGKTTQAEAGMIGSHRFPMYRPINGSIDIDYLISYLLTKRGTDILEAASPGGAGRNRTLGQDRFMKSRIVLPPLDEQKKIAEILSTQDKAIELQGRKIEELKRFKKGCLEKMFPRKGQKVPEKRFPGFTDDWEQRKLGGMASLITKGTTPLDKSNTGVVNFVKIESIDESSGNITITQKISLDEHNGCLHRSQLKENDILFSIAGTLGRVTSVKSSILPANTNQALAIIRLKDGCLDYVKTYLKGKAVADFIKKNPTIGAQPNLSLEQVANLGITIPSEDEQKKIGAFFQQLDNLITLHQRKLEEMKKQKKALMQLLLTGIVRVQS